MIFSLFIIIMITYNLLKKSILLQQVDGIVAVILFFNFICTVCPFLMESKLNAPGTGIKI